MGRLYRDDGSQQRNTKLKKTGQKNHLEFSKPRIRRGSNQMTCRRVTVPTQSRKLRSAARPGFCSQCHRLPVVAMLPEMNIPKVSLVNFIAMFGIGTVIHP